jgi:hypothetical protein
MERNRDASTAHSGQAGSALDASSVATIWTSPIATISAAYSFRVREPEADTGPQRPHLLHPLPRSAWARTGCGWRGAPMFALFRTP